MTDVYTVTFVSMVEDESESVPWQFTFADLDLAKSHVLEEAAHHAQATEGIEPESRWEDFEDYSTFIQTYNPGFTDAWLVIRTELVEKPPSGQLSPL